MSEKKRRLSSQDNLLETVRSLPSDHIARIDTSIMTACVDASVKVLPGDRTVAALALGLLYNQKRRISSVNNKDLLKILFHSVLSDDETFKDCLYMSKVERNLFIPFFMKAAEKRKPVDPSAQRHLTILMRLLDRFRSLIVERFEPLVDKQTSAHVWGRKQHGINVDGEDARQNHRLAVIRSTDKFNPEKGTLTSYVGLWMKNAPHSSFSLATGESFKLTRSARSKIHNGKSDLNNHSVPIDDAVNSIASPSQEWEQQENDIQEKKSRLVELVSALEQSGRLDEVKYALAVMLYPFELREDQKRALQRTMQ